MSGDPVHFTFLSDGFMENVTLDVRSQVVYMVLFSCESILEVSLGLTVLIELEGAVALV